MAEIVSVTYTASDGTVVPFQMEKLIRIKTANFHNWSYEPQTIERRFGVKVLQFGKHPASYQTRLYFGGNPESRKARTDTFHTLIERDIRKNKSGRLTWGDYFLDCFIKSSSTFPEEGYTANDIEIYAPYPFWIKEAVYNFFPTNVTPDESEWLDYPYGYEHDYTPRDKGLGYVVNNATGDARFRMTFFGAAYLPSVNVGGTEYGVLTNLNSGEYLTIDSRNGTVTKTMNTGQVLNVFNSRVKSGKSIFTPIPVGRSSFIWSGEFGVELIIYQERSEPAWT